MLHSYYSHFFGFGMIYNTFWLEKVVKKLCVTYTFGCCRRTQNSFYSVWKNSHKNFSLSSISLTTTCSNYFYLYNERRSSYLLCVCCYSLSCLDGTVLWTRVSISVYNGGSDGYLAIDTIIREQSAQSHKVYTIHTGFSFGKTPSSTPYCNCLLLSERHISSIVLSRYRFFGSVLS